MKLITTYINYYCFIYSLAKYARRAASMQHTTANTIVAHLQEHNLGQLLPSARPRFENEGPRDPNVFRTTGRAVREGSAPPPGLAIPLLEPSVPSNLK